MGRLEARQRVQQKIYNEFGKLNFQTDLEVAKMYWKSKKKVYGIDNELHLVEQVQSCMKILFKSSHYDQIKHEDIINIFEGVEGDQSKTDNEETDDDQLKYHLPQLDVNQLLTLKIAYNLKELTYQKNVKKFFFGRFKRRLIKQNIIKKI